MHKNNHNPQPQSNNSNYLSWFVRDAQDLKRGGTAPIMPSRKSRQTAHNDPFNVSQDNDSALNNDDTSKNIPVITTSYGTSNPLNQSRGAGTPTGESHRITKVAHPSGVSVYRLTKKKSITSENNSQLPHNAFEALNNGLTSPAQKQDRSRNTPGLPSTEDITKDFQDTPLSFMSPGVSSSSFNARPGSSHVKGGSAFRRTRILNESSQNNEEFQTPNTGNLDLESLNNLNNQSTGRDTSPPSQYEQRSKHDLRSAQDSRIGVNLRQPMRQQAADPFESELDNIAQLKNFNEARIPQRGHLKGNGFRQGGGIFGNDDNNDHKAVRVMTADVKQGKQKPVIEGRRYAEDVEALNISDDDGFGPSGIQTNTRNTATAKEQTRGDKESLVTIIGRNMQGENAQPKKNESIAQQRHEDEENIFSRGNPQKFTLDFADAGSTLDSNLTPHQRGFVQRPPARKNYQAMNLDDRSMQSEKKPLMMSPAQEQHFERPPSRHKIPTKALGLDLPEEPTKNTPMGILQTHERETPVQGRRDGGTIGRRGNNLRTGESDFEFDNNDFENLNFNKVLDLSDFLEGDEAPQNQSRTQARPKTTAGVQRDSFQSGQQPKNQGIGIGIGKHVGLQSAKGRPISGLGHNPLLSSKLEAFNNMRNNRSAKESRLENAFNPSKDHSKMKSQHKINNDLENCDVYLMESDSDDSFEASLSNRQSFNNTNGISRNQSGSKLWGQEKSSKKDGLQLNQNTFKDKKSQIVFIHSKGTHSTKKENIDLPFETTLEKDFVGLFAN